MVVQQFLSFFALFAPLYWENLSSFQVQLTFQPVFDPFSTLLEALQILVGSPPLLLVLLEARGYLCREPQTRESTRSTQEHQHLTEKQPKPQDQVHSLLFVTSCSTLEFVVVCYRQHFVITSPSLAISRLLYVIINCFCTLNRPLSFPMNDSGAQSKP